MRRSILRLAYGVGFLAFVFVAWWAASGRLFQAAGMNLDAMAPSAFARIVIPAFALGGVAPFLAAFGYLAWRPQWWGKFLVLPAPPAWIMCSAMGAFISQTELGHPGPGVWVPAMAGVVMAAVAVVLFVADPRWSNRPLAD